MFEDLCRERVAEQLEILGADRPKGVDNPGEQGSANQGSTPRRAAVAVVLCPDAEGYACFILTRRAATLRRHSGQWALPGGRLDAGETPIDAALRELEEEVGLGLEGCSAMGVLHDFHTRSGFQITPVVCWHPEEPELVPNPEEVESVHLVRLESLDRPEVPLERFIAESDRPVISLPILGTQVFAPTAAVVYQLFELVARRRLVQVAHYEQPKFAWR